MFGETLSLGRITAGLVVLGREVCVFGAQDGYGIRCVMALDGTEEQDNHLFGRTGGEPALRVCSYPACVVASMQNGLKGSGRPTRCRRHGQHTGTTRAGWVAVATRRGKEPRGVWKARAGHRVPQVRAGPRVATDSQDTRMAPMVVGAVEMGNRHL